MSPERQSVRATRNGTEGRKLMSAEGDFAVLVEGQRKALGTEVRIWTALGVVDSAFLILLLLVIPAPFGAIAVTVLLLLLWVILGGAVLRNVSRSFAGRPETMLRSFKGAAARWYQLLGSILLPPLAIAILLGVVLAVLQLRHLGVVGTVLLVILSPVVLGAAGGAVWLGVRWLAAGHLAGPAAVEGASVFGAVSRALAYLRAAPTRVVLFELLGVVLAVGRSLPALVAGVVVAALPAFLVGIGDPFAHPPDILPHLFLYLVAVAALAWGLSAVLSSLFGTNVGLYLVHRRALDGVPVTEGPAERKRPKSLAELGFELVKRLEAEEPS